MTYQYNSIKFTEVSRSKNGITQQLTTKSNMNNDDDDENDGNG